MIELRILKLGEIISNMLQQHVKSSIKLRVMQFFALQRAKCLSIF